MKNLTFFIILMSFAGCKTVKEPVSEPKVNSVYALGPSAIIYKTKSDYYNLVPVTLSEDRSKIIAYPHPSDLRKGDGLAKPTVLADGYLLDNRGINQNVAFLRYTYEEYSKIKDIPSIEELYMNIIDKDPLLEICNCGLKSSYKNIEEELNRLISSEKLYETCKILYKK